MNISDIMNVNATRIRLGATMSEAAVLVSQSQTSDLMVVDGDNNFVGVLSEGDLIRKAMPQFEELAESGGSMTDAFELFLEKAAHLRTQPIDALVIRSPISVRSTDAVLTAASTMVLKQIRRLPVVDGGKLVGTISRGDLCRGVLR